MVVLLMIGCVPIFYYHYSRLHISEGCIDIYSDGFNEPERELSLPMYHVPRCILDGEMLVWDKSANRFVEFGSNQEIGFPL